MRIAIFHDYIRVIGGGEKLVLTMARHLKADVITTDCDRSLIEKMGFSDVNVISLGSLIRVAPFKQIQATLKFALCDFSKKYDFFIFSGNWAHYASRKHQPNLLYCHTPVRVFYDLRDNAIASKKNPLTKLAAITWIAVHGYFDRRSISRIERIATNSRNTAGRIKKFYGRDSTVIYPPCDTARLKNISDDGFWLSVNRLYPEKRIEFQIEAFRQMPERKLIIIGNHGVGDNSAAYAKMLEEQLPSNVSIIRNVSEEDLINYYGRCTGLITTAMDEDFGMTAIEAMAAGKPVIAVNEGGYLESVVDGKTGILIECSLDIIIQAVIMISKNPSDYKETSLSQAAKFNIERFGAQIDKLITDNPFR